MKIAIPASAPALDARVERRLGTAPYLLVVETADLSFDAMEGAPPSHCPGAGVQALTMVLGKGAKALLAGYISPHIAATLRQNGIEVITPVSGTVRDAMGKYMRGEFLIDGSSGIETAEAAPHPARVRWRDALRKASRQFSGMFPVLTGVILLVGLFKAFLPGSFLIDIFSGDMLQDTLLGTGIGTVMAGNPINSYVIGETLLKIGWRFSLVFSAVAVISALTTAGMVGLLDKNR